MGKSSGRLTEEVRIRAAIAGCGDVDIEAVSSGEFSAYRGRPVAFCEDVLGFHPWGPDDSPTNHGGQQAILNDLWAHRFVVVASCNNAGKTMLAAHAALTFLHTFPQSIVLSTAPTWHQVEGLLWRRIREAGSRARTKLPGSLTNTGVDLAPMWFARGLSTNEEERFQGYHPENVGAMLVIVDEASGVGEHIYSALAGYLTGSNVYMLWIGNPTKAEGPPYEAFKAGRWIVPFKAHRISAYDVPESVLTDRDWAARMLETYGEEHSQYRIRVLGEYVEGSTDQLFPAWLLESCKNLQNPLQGDGKHIGVDVARHGGDSTVATLTEEGVVKAVEVWGDADLTLHAERLAELARAWGVPGSHIHIDIGMGAGVADRLREAGIEVDLVDWGAAPDGDWPEEIGDTKVPNRKAEMHWIARQLFHQRRLCVPERFQLTWQQLGWIRADWDEREFLQIEKKAKLKTRTGGESPDFADSLILSLSRAGTGWGVY